MTFHVDFPGGPGVRNPPANAGDMGSIPGPFTCRGAAEPIAAQLLQPEHPRPATGAASTARGPRSPHQRKPTQQEHPRQPKLKNEFSFPRMCCDI